jgi:hypothetical protein
MINVICILKENTFNRIKEEFKDKIELRKVNTLEDLKQEITVFNTDFIIIDYNNYDYHSFTDYIESRNIKYYNFDGKFDKINEHLNKEIQRMNVNEKDIKKEKEVQIINKYIEVEKEVIKEKIVEKPVERIVEKPVEKIVEKKIYGKAKIGIISEKKGIGSTHYSFTIANYLKQKNKSVVIVEIGKNELSRMKKYGIDLKYFPSVDDYYSDISVRNYDYIIMDLGHYERDNFKELFLPCDIKISILGSKEYEEGGLSNFLKLVSSLKIARDINYIYNFSSEKRFKEIMYELDGMNIHRGTYNEDFNITEDVQNTLDSILDIDNDNKKSKFKLDTIIINIIIVILLILVYVIYRNII